MKINGGLIALLVIIILVTIAVIGFVWWKFFYKKNEKNSGFLTNYRFKKTTHLISMNKKHQANSGIVLTSGKLTFFRNIKIKKELKLNNWSARVSEQLSGIIIAAPGSGKTQSTILPTIIFNAIATDKPRMIITDPKGECYKATNNFLKKQGIKTYVLNFNDSNSTDFIYTHCFNPLSNIIELHKQYVCAKTMRAKEIYLGKLQSKIDKFFNLFDVFNSKNVEPFWWNKGKEMNKLMLALMLFSLENKEFNFVNIYSYEQINLGNLYNNINQTNMIELAEKLNEISSSTASKKFENWFIHFKGWAESRKEAISDFKQNATDLLDIFKDPEIRYLTAKSDFDLHDFLKNQSVLFFVLPNSETKRKIANFFLEIFYDNLVEIISNNYDDKLPFPCWFIVDEAGTMQTISWLGEVLNQGRGRNMHSLMVFQNTEQIDAKYKGQGLTKSSQYKILYSSQDLKYAEEISKAIGYKNNAKTSQDLIIKPSEILKIEPEKALVISVKENKPYFTNNLPFYKVKDIKYETSIYSQPIFVLNKKYLEIFDFKKILENILTENGISLQIEKIIKKENNEQTTENENISKTKFTKKTLNHEWNLFLENNNFDDEILNELNEIYDKVVEYVLDFYKSSTAETYNWNFERIFEQIEILLKKYHLNWQFLFYLKKTIEKQAKLKQEQFEMWKNKSKKSKDKELTLELNIFLEQSDLSEIQQTNIKNQFLLLIANFKAFEKVVDKTQNQTIYQKIMENIDKIWNQIDRNIEWSFLKKLQNELKEKYKANKELYEIIEFDDNDDFEFDLSGFEIINNEEPQKQKNETKDVQVSSFERKPSGSNPLLNEAMMKFWREKWGDKLADEIFKDEKKKELNKNE